MGLLCQCLDTWDKVDGIMENTSHESDAELRSSAESGNLLALQFNDTNLQPTFSPSAFDDKALSIGRFSSFDSNRRPTLTYAPTLAQMVKFNIGNELLCMSWNMHHRCAGVTPFDFYCDLRNFDLAEFDTIMIEIAWDLSRVLFVSELSVPWCNQILLRKCVPSILLAPGARSKFSNATQLSNEETEWYTNTTLHDFLKAHTYNKYGSVFGNTLSFITQHNQSIERKSSPWIENYDCNAFEQLLETNPTLLPLLILDSLHVLVVKFSVFLIQNKLRMAFSELTSDIQIEYFKIFLEQSRIDDLSLPKFFVEVKNRLWTTWKTAFQDSNKIEQLKIKASQSQTDIILLQQVTSEVFAELNSKFSPEWLIIPEEFPLEEKLTTVICLRKGKINLADDWSSTIRRTDSQNFAVLCRSGEILFYVGVVNLSEGQEHAKMRKQKMLQFQKILGKNTQVILGGEFNEDLTSHENPVAKTMLRMYNGIDHTQEEPLAFSMHRTRTNLQFEVSKADTLEKDMGYGIFSTFPLVGDAFTDYLHPGLQNPSDHGPVFQRIQLSVF